MSWGPTIYAQLGYQHAGLFPNPSPSQSIAGCKTYIAHTVSHENRRGRKTLLRRAGHIRHTDIDDQKHHGTEKADDGVAGYWGRGVMVPVTFPDHDAAGDDREAA